MLLVVLSVELTSALLTMVATMFSKMLAEVSKVASSTRPVTHFFRPQLQKSTTEVETRWAMFVSKHNVAFLTSDHATKLFPKMFPDSEIAKQVACARTKTTAIVKEALSPHYHKTTTKSMCNPFSVLIDESNDKTGKSCIVLVKVLDSTVGDIRTRFLDIPVVNIGTAQNLYAALKSSLSGKGFDFSNLVAFMCDTTNVMKGARSGVQKLIKNDNPQVYDVGCICHLADLTVKAGMQILPIDIDQFFIDVVYFFLS